MVSKYGPRTQVVFLLDVRSEEACFSYNDSALHGLKLKKKSSPRGGGSAHRSDPLVLAVASTHHARRDAQAGDRADFEAFPDHEPEQSVLHVRRSLVDAGGFTLGVFEPFLTVCPCCFLLSARTKHQVLQFVSPMQARLFRG